jgi:hypothetical protein
LAEHAKEAAMNARETAERHGGYVLAGNMAAVGGDFTPEAMQAFMQLGIRPPRGTNKYEIVGESQDGDQTVYDIKYSNDAESLTIRSTWGKVGEEWKIVKAEKV